MKSRILIIFAVIILSTWGVLAVLNLPNGVIPEQPSNGYATPINSSKQIVLADAGASCRNITSSTSTQYFIPTRTTAESSSFLANPPNGITVDACAPTGNVCWTFTCHAVRGTPWSNPNVWLTPACWNNFKNQVLAWNTSGYLTTVQKDQVIADGHNAWANTCWKFDAAKTTVGWYYKSQNLAGPLVTGSFILDTEEFAHFWWCDIDASVICPNTPSVCKSPSAGEFTADMCVGYPYGNAELIGVDIDGIAWYDEYWQSNVLAQWASVYNSCAGKPVKYKTQAQIDALSLCSGGLCTWPHSLTYKCQAGSLANDCNGAWREPYCSCTYWWWWGFLGANPVTCPASNTKLQ